VAAGMTSDLEMADNL